MAELLEANEIFYTAFQPKLANQFYMYLEGIPSFTIKATDRPTFSINKVTLDHVNLKRHVAGKGEWGDVNITLYDPIVPSGAQAVMEWVRLHHESVTGRSGYSDFYKKDVTIVVVGPPGDKIEEWTLKGAFITNASFNSLDWADDSPLMVNLTLSIDYAILQF